jgi:hypothetical protein
MMPPFDSIKDTSIWRHEGFFQAAEKKDGYLRIGIVKRIFKVENAEMRYHVEIRDRNDRIEINCRLLRKFGGVFNYEDTVMHGYKFDNKPDPVETFGAKAGDMVLVGYINGESREGIIIGGLDHPARSSDLDVTKGPQFKSEFNGIETSINEDGEYTVVFRAIPTNIAELDNTPADQLPSPEYDTTIGGSFFMFDKTGSFEINDVSQTIGEQSYRIDKANGTIETKSGNISLKFTKEPEQVDLKCKITNIVSDDTFNNTTKEYSLDASTSTKIKSPKVAIGKDGIELLDQLSQLIDALGKVIAISPVGPCNPLVTSPEWQEVASVQSKIKEITGGL